MPIVVAMITWIITAVLSVTVIGLLLVPFVQFYGQVAVFRMFGSAFASVNDRIDTESAGNDAGAVGGDDLAY
jgi:hypothetical protein